MYYSLLLQWCQFSDVFLQHSIFKWFVMSLSPMFHQPRCRFLTKDQIDQILSHALSIVFLIIFQSRLPRVWCLHDYHYTDYWFHTHDLHASIRCLYHANLGHNADYLYSLQFIISPIRIGYQGTLCLNRYPSNLCQYSQYSSHIDPH